MTDTIRVLGISGSLRQASWNTIALRAAQKLAPAGMVIEICEIRDLPFYDGDVEAAGMPASVAAFRAKVAAAAARVTAVTTTEEEVGRRLGPFVVYFILLYSICIIFWSRMTQFTRPLYVISQDYTIVLHLV